MGQGFRLVFIDVCVWASMTASLSESPLMATENLLSYYNFQDETQTQDELLDRWLRSYPERWVRLALIEALYQGRYKSISVELLLEMWQRRGQPIYHFNGEFAALVCHNVPQTFVSLKHPKAQSDASQQPMLPTPLKQAQEVSAGTVQPQGTPRPGPALQDDTSSIDAIPAMTLASAAATEQDLRLESVQPVPSPDIEEPELAPQATVQLALDDASQEDWLTAELEMTAVENVQAFVKQVSQQTDATTSPIHYFTPVAQDSTGLYSRLAAIANTRA